MLPFLNKMYICPILRNRFLKNSKQIIFYVTKYQRIYGHGCTKKWS